MPPGAVLAATAHDASRSQGQDFEDQFGWHNSLLRPPATLRREPTMLHKQAVEWPKPGDIVLDAVFKKLSNHNTHAWTERRILVTRNTLHIARDSEILESIAISSIVRLSCSEFDLVRDPSSEQGNLKTCLHNSEQTAAASTFSLITIAEGLGTQKQIHFKSCDPDASASDIILWVKELADIMKRDLALSNQRRKFERIQRASKMIFDHSITKGVVVFIIILSFLSDVAEAQVLPKEGSKLASMFLAFEFTFTLIFLVELLWNLVSNFLQPFLKDGWSLFDTVVVAVSLVMLFAADANDGIKSIRLVRVARALRLVGRFQSLRAIVEALTQAIFPMMSACILFVMTMSIFAILGVSFFRDVAPTFFGDFGLAMFTLFGTLTLENWISVAVEVMGGNPSNLDPGVMFYFVSYIVLVGYVLTSVVVAVLLTAFSDAIQKESANASKIKKSEGDKLLALKVSSNPLDPILMQLSTCENSQDLTNRIGLLFQVLDVDESGTVSPEEVVMGLAKLNFMPRIQCTLDDFNDITRDRALCLPDGTLDRGCFECVLRKQLRDYISRSIAVTGSIMQSGSNSALSAVLAGINQVLLDLPANSTCVYSPARSPSRPHSTFTKANDRGNDKYKIVAEQVHPHEGDEGRALGVTGNAGHFIVPPQPVNVLEAIGDKPSKIVLGVLNLERRLEHAEQQLANLHVTLTSKDAELCVLEGRHQHVLAGLEQAQVLLQGLSAFPLSGPPDAWVNAIPQHLLQPQDKGGVACHLIAESVRAQILDVIAQSKQLLSHGLTARQDVKREDLAGLDWNTEMKGPSVKTPDTKSSLCSLCGQTYVSTMLTVRQEQKADWQPTQALARAEAQHSVFRPPNIPPPGPPPDTRFNHIGRHMAEETEQGGQGGRALEGESGVGTGVGQEQVLSTRQVTTPRAGPLLPTDDSSDDEKVTELMRDVQNLTGMRWLRYQHSMSTQERLLPLPPAI